MVGVPIMTDRAGVEPSLAEVDPLIADVLEREALRQSTVLEMIPSENYASRAVIEAVGSVLTNKYAEGYPAARYYQGNDVVDAAEVAARDRATALFGFDHANVQPHSGTQANMAVYLGLIRPGDTVMGMQLDAGGHLTHGHSVNASGKLYNFVSYGVERESETIDFDSMLSLAKEHRPKMIVVGATAYPRQIDFARAREVADEVDAVLMADIAHVAGLVAGDAHPRPGRTCPGRDDQYPQDVAGPPWWDGALRLALRAPRGPRRLPGLAGWADDERDRRQGCDAARGGDRRVRPGRAPDGCKCPGARSDP